MGNFRGGNYLEDRLLDQAHARAPYTPLFGGSFMEHTPKHDIGCLTPCKTIILRDKLSSNEFFDFDPSTPPPPLPGNHFFLGGGFKNWLAHGRHCALIQTQVPFHFVLPHGPPNQQWRPQVLSPTFPGQPPYGALPVST